MQPLPASRMQRHACTVLESGSSPGGLSGHRVKSKQPSLPLSQGGLEWGPEAPPHTLLHGSASRGPFPCCFSICLITKQKLQSGLLYFYM